MDFMGIGPFELLLVLIIGFLLLGPDKLPQMAAKAGQLYRNFKKATFDLSKTITEDLSTEKKTITEDLSNMSKAITEDLSAGEKSDDDSMTASVPEANEKSNVESTGRTTPASVSEEKVNER